ncbi:tol-pal system protein YbgF [Shewanella sp. VB17]|uniref:tol-pal system protein YbgF n=1 Tax=Shewanella sp. VB17 TaxID=2739432 RepID=UPI0015644292|nr:tol-pal system protein YbgF [Shewanella sp. VB17]NRD73763.1 tol-pal system protein YbgF [Shewanella sp. VB17]
MKNAVLSAAILLSIGAVIAAPAPVADITGGSTDERVARLERIVKAKQQSEYQMQSRLDTLQQEVLDLRGLNEQQSYQLDQVLQRQRQLYDDIANLTVNRTSVSAASSSPSEAGHASTLSETASYEQALNLVLKQKKYDEAIYAFGAFIKNYPNSTYSANANYWLGQLLYNKGEFTSAKKVFNTVVDNFKESNKRGDSLVKLGMIAEKAGNRSSAEVYYQQVLKEYANSSAARIAQQKLTAL